MLAVATPATKLTGKQRRRLDDLSEKDNVRVIGWAFVHRGPLVKFPTGVVMAITRDGGLYKV